MNQFLGLSTLFVGVTTALGINAFFMYRKIIKRNHNIIFLGKSRKTYLLGVVAMAFTLFLYFAYDVPDNFLSFIAMLGIVTSYTFFSFMYKDLVPFYSEEGIFINDSEVPYQDIVNYKITNENEKGQRVNLNYRTVSKGKLKKEKIEWGVVRPDQDTFNEFTKRLRAKKVRRIYDK